MSASTAGRLRRVIGTLPSERVALGSVIDALGASGLGFCLLLFGLTALIPGIAPVFGVALCAVSIGMTLGYDKPLLPGRMRQWQLDRGRLLAGLERLAPYVDRLERWLHLRRRSFPGGPGTRVIGLASLLNGVLIVLPIPFGNTAPAVAMIVLALGFIVGDGLAVAIGLAFTTLAFVLDVGLIFLGFTAVSALLTSLF